MPGLQNGPFWPVVSLASGERLRAPVAQVFNYGIASVERGSPPCYTMWAEHVDMALRIHGISYNETSIFWIPRRSLNVWSPVSWNLNELPGPFVAVGNTPLVPVDVDGVRIWLKLEGSNPSGSVKDRAAAAMIKEKIKCGELTPGRVLLDASSGNMASALSSYGRALGPDAHVVCNSTITADKRRMIEHFEATLIQNDYGPYTHDGYLKCLDLVRQSDNSYCFLDQLHNPMNPYAHETGTGPEILKDLPSVRLIVGSLGSGGTMLGIGRAVRSAGHPAMVAAVSSAPGNRMAGVGAFADGDYRTPFMIEAETNGLFTEAVLVTVASAQKWQREITARGLFCGAQTGAVLGAAMDLAKRHGLRDGIVIVSGDAGWKSWSS